MKSRLGLIVLIAAGVGLVAIALFIALRGRPGKIESQAQPPVVAQPGEQPPKTAGPIKVSGTELTVEEAGKVIWRASFGGQIELDERGRTARAEQVNWSFEGQGFKGLHLRAPLMQADYDLRQLRFSQGVSIEAEAGAMRFSAREVVYEFNTQKLIATGGVSMRRGSYLLTGDRLVIDNHQRKIRVTRGTLRREG